MPQGCYDEDSSNINDLYTEISEKLLKTIEEFEVEINKEQLMEVVFLTLLGKLDNKELMSDIVEQYFYKCLEIGRNARVSGN